MKASKSIEGKQKSNHNESKIEKRFQNLAIASGVPLFLSLSLGQRLVIGAESVALGIGISWTRSRLVARKGLAFAICPDGLVAVAILCHLRSSAGWRHSSVLRAVLKAIVESGGENLNKNK